MSRSFYLSWIKSNTPTTERGKPPFPRIKRFSALSLLLVLLFSFTSVVLPGSEALAEDGLTAGTPARVANTDGDGVRLRENASASASVITTIAENELVTIKGGPTKDREGNAFYKVSYEDKTGYAMTQYLIFAGKANKARPLPVGSPAKIANSAGDSVNMRQQASAGAPVLNLLPEGTLFLIMGGPFTDKQDNAFYRIDYKGQVGYVMVAYVAAAPRNSVVSGGGGFLKVTNTDGDPIRFRTGPGRSFEPNGHVYEGQVLKRLSVAVSDDSSNKWYRVERGNETGYVDAAFLRQSEAPSATPPPAAAPAPAPKKPPVLQPPPSNGSLGERVVTYSKQFLGWRYVWGGGSPSAGGFDCSGFVLWVMSQHGIRGGHSVESWVDMGKAVPLPALQPGDVLIWANTYKPGPSHIGIYIGGGRFIHAENESSGVTLTEVGSSYYASRFYAARRIGV